MKRSVAMMACVLSGVMVFGSFSPVMAETGAKAVSATVADSKTSDDKKDDAKADTTDKKDDAKDTVLEDGIYSAEFDTDSSMFHVNEANDGKGTLTVKDGKMTLHVSLASKNIVNLFVGTAEDAQKDGAELLQPTTDTVTYSDGTTEEVYGFDIPVEAIDEEFDLALIGKKNKWYDHKVKVTNPQKESDETTATEDAIYVNRCGNCGIVVGSRREPGTAAGKFQQEIQEKISSAVSAIEAGDNGSTGTKTVVIDTGIWTCFNQKVLDELAKHPNVSLEIHYSYKNVRYVLVIPAGADLEAIRREDGFYGFRYLDSIFGGYEEQK